MPNDVRVRGEQLPLDLELRDLYKELIDLRDGEIATYIPPLADADPEWFGLAVATVDGHCYSVGDDDVTFTIQSVSKPFVFGLALDDLGVEGVAERVGTEPTGNAFNSITVDERSGRPFNPMVNAGAIVTASLVDGFDPADRDRRLLDRVSRFAGRTLDVDEIVFEAERHTGDRNRAIAYLMRTFGMLREDVDCALETYFRQCSMLVDVRDLALMGATLANDGVNPVTGERALRSEHVARVLSVMSTCGMYDYAGEWLYRIGLPAKSGVSGGIVAVLPGVLAVASFSPPLDARGNSLRGIRACEVLTNRFNLHVFDGIRATPVVRAGYDGAVARSRRRRSAAHSDALRAVGARLQIVEVQGPLQFGTAEVLSRAVAERAGGASSIVLDVSRVTSVDDGVLPLFRAMTESCRDLGVVVHLVGRCASALDDLDVCVVHETLEAALERCEDELLHDLGLVSPDEVLELVDHELLDGLSADLVAALVEATTVETLEAGATVFRQGDDADAVYFVLAGRVRVGVHDGDRYRRITTIGPGDTFGEMAVISGGRRTTDIHADTDTVCRVLSLGALGSLESRCPGVILTLYRNLLRTASWRLRDANDHIRALQH